jgi:ABC-type lipoprotein export system ATPase subunit
VARYCAHRSHGKRRSTGHNGKGELEVSELVAVSADAQDHVEQPEGVLDEVRDSYDPMTPVLQLKSVGKTYRRGDEQVHVLVDFDFTLHAGEFVVVTGPSGAGKSTLLHIAGGLDAPDNGTVAVAGQDIWAKSAGARAAFRRRHLGFVFQFFNLVPMLTAVENVSLPLVLDGMRARTADARAEELLERVGLGDRARHRPAELSGGQMQRVAVARALVARPSLILADEPTGNLDSHSSTEVLDLLRSLSDEDGAAVVLVTHDQAATRYGTRELRLVDGQAYGADTAEPFAERR